MKKNVDGIRWHRLLKTVVAMVVVMAMLLCGCGGENADENTKDKNNTPSGGVLGDGDGKLEAQDLVDGFTTVYGSLLSAMGGNAKPNYGTEMDMTITLGQELMASLEESLAQSGMTMDMAWLENIGINMDIAYQEDKSQIQAGATLNGKTIVSLDMIMDMLTGKFYMGAPELNPQYITTTMDMSMVQSPVQQLQNYADIVTALPTDQQLNTLLTRYLDLALAALKDPVTENTTLSYQSVSQNVTAKNYTILRSDVLKMATQILTAAQTDAELEQMLDKLGVWYNTKCAEMAQANGAQWVEIDMHGQIMEAVAEALDEIAELQQDLEDGNFLTFTAYLDGEKTIGFRLSVDQGYDAVQIVAYSLTNGNNTAFVLDLAGSMQLKGLGTLSGNKASGSYTLYNRDLEMMRLDVKDFDTKALQQGELKGTVRVTPMFPMDTDTAQSGMMAALSSIELVLDVSGDRASVTVKLYSGEMLLVSLDITSKMTSSGSVRVPSDTVDAEDSAGMQTWLENLDLEQILDNLRGAGVPKELMDMLDQALQQGVMPIAA